MARLRRIVLAGQPHLVIHRGNNGQAVFIDALDSECYLASLRECARAAGVGIHGYGLYTTEVRLLVTPDSPSGLARMMQGIGRQYVEYPATAIIRSLVAIEPPPGHGASVGGRQLIQQVGLCQRNDKPIGQHFVGTRDDQHRNVQQGNYQAQDEAAGNEMASVDAGERNAAGLDGKPRRGSNNAVQHGRQGIGAGRPYQSGEKQT